VKIFPIFIPHAGCPHRCLFCAQDRSTSASKVPDADTVTVHLDRILPRDGDGEIAFYGGTFTLLPQECQHDFLTAAGRFVAAGRVAGIRISTRPDALDRCIVAGLASRGVTTVEIGCQSFSSRVLDAAGRGHAVADNIRAVNVCLEAGLRVGVQLMPGLPGGDDAEAMASLRQALALGPSFLRIYPTVVLEGTRLAQLWRSGSYRPWLLDEAVDLCANMLTLCRQAGVPVVRLGLQQDPQLESNLLAGPFHPAFGQLVRSRLWRRVLGRIEEGHARVSVHPDDLSDVIGHRNENRIWLAGFRPKLQVTTDGAVARGSLRAYGNEPIAAEIHLTGVING